ncbi:MAG: hypothetical protein DHS80DRAFT_29448 [Piptocephalis tieghemiana]|nr:MAG: hypothetical protein DHS80DRAFT_29448 [Piptocephalis tieghemiana]
MPRGYRLIVRAGSCADDLTLLDPYKAEPCQLTSEHFTGTVTVRLLDHTRDQGNPDPYFADLPNTTFSLTLQGHFGETLCKTLTGKDLVFGNVFDAPLPLPTGSSLAVRALRWAVDPGLEADLWCPQPWAHSPLLITMAAIRVEIPETEEEEDEEKKEDYSKPVQEDSSLILPGSVDGTSASARQRYFSSQENLEDFHFRPTHRYTCAFRNGLVDLNNLTLNIPGWGGVDLLRFWDGRVIRFVLQSRDGQIKLLVVEFQLEADASEGESKVNE